MWRLSQPHHELNFPKVEMHANAKFIKLSVTVVSHLAKMDTDIVLEKRDTWESDASSDGEVHHGNPHLTQGEAEWFWKRDNEHKSKDEARASRVMKVEPTMRIPTLTERVYVVYLSSNVCIYKIV